MVISSLLQARVESARLSGNGVELSIALANGVRLRTQSPNPLEPNWSLSFNADNPGHLYIQNGVLRVDHAGG